jgi:O-succinylbenzoic acid--CoA ligase
MTSWLEIAAARCPQRIALEGPTRSLTYAELAREAAGLAERLARTGAGGGPVAVELPPGEEFVIALHACMLAGAPIMPIDLRLTPSERERRRAGAVMTLDGAPAGCGGGATARRASSASASTRSVADPERVLAVMHTSGTTAEPKRIELTHRNFLHSALASAAMLGLALDERWLCPMPLTHVGGLSIPIRSAIYATTVVLHGRFQTERVLEELMDPGRRITLVSLVPTMLARLLDAGLRQPPTLRWVLLGGGPIAPALIERSRAAGVPLAPTYGMTEACSQIATFGFPLPGVEVRLAAETTEILVRGPIVAPGARGEDGWLHTGDLGAFEEHGRLRIVGRVADTIVTGGENVAPTEVEAALLEHPEVADAGVRGRPDPEWGEALVATVVLRDGPGVSAEELREFCAQRIARYKVPKQITFAAALPRTASGKLLRRQLP